MINLSPTNMIMKNKMTIWTVFALMKDSNTTYSLIRFWDPAAKLQKIHKTEVHVNQSKRKKLYRSPYTSSSTEIVKER